MKLTEAQPVRWGGLQGRYKDFPGPTVRAYDPYGLAPLSFKTNVEMTAWRLVRFGPQVKTVTGRPTRVQAKVEGQELEAQATFIAILRSGQREYHLVCDMEPSASNWRLLQQIAAKNRAAIEVHRRATVLADGKLNSRLDRLMQASVLHLRDGPGADPLIVAAVRDGAGCRAELIRRLPHLSAQLIDGRAAQLHCSGVLTLDPSADDYGVGLGGGRRG